MHLDVCSGNLHLVARATSCESKLKYELALAKLVSCGGNVLGNVLGAGSGFRPVGIFAGVFPKVPNHQTIWPRPSAVGGAGDISGRSQFSYAALVPTLAFMFA